MFTFLGIFDSGWWAACTKNATLEILLMLLAAGLIGWLLRRYFSNDGKKIEALWQGKLDKLTGDYNNSIKHNKSLKADIEGLNVKLGKFSMAATENEALQSRLGALQLQLDSGQKELASAKSALNEEHQKLLVAMKPAGDIELLQNRVNNLTAELEDTKKSAASYRSSLDAANAEKAKYASSIQMNEAEDLRKKIGKLESDLNSSRLLVTKYQTESKDLDERKAKIAEEAKVVNEQRAELDGLKSKLSRTEEDLAKARTGLAELTQVKNDLVGVTSDRDKWKSEADAQAKSAADALQWRDKAASFERDLNVAREEAGKYKSDYAAAKTEQDNLNAALSTAKTAAGDSEALKSRISSLESEKNNLAAELSTAKSAAADVESLRGRINGLETEKNNLLAQLNTAKSAAGDSESLKSRISALENEKNNLSGELNNWKTKAGDTDTLRNRVNSLEGEKNNLTAELNAARTAAGDVNGLKARLQTVENDLNGERNRYGGLKRDYDALLAEKNSWAMKAAAPAPAKKYDDLEIIEGIGPKIEKLLYKGGIHTYCELADTSPAKISEIIIREGGESYRIHDPGTWPEQAALLCAGKKKEFEELAAKLKGGKRVGGGSGKKDDLKKIEGIGPKIEQLLHKGGIHTFYELSEANVDRLKEILHEAGERFQMHDPTTWPKQAGYLAEGKLEEFKKYTDKLKGGRPA
jgi:predicted flap endonuclease-1-like 5' DNA nuclease/predicted  nucleic acid-binding Zn-ribbon protein